MRATVIIPTYNRPRRLARLLECLVEQEGDLVQEVLVCDDGSRTDTRAAIEPFASRLPGLRLLWQPDLGFRAGQARNLGIRVARGDVLIFLDDDLLLPRGFVAGHVSAHAAAVNGSPKRRVVLGFRHRTTEPVAEMPTLESILSSFPDDRVEHIGPDGQRIAAHPHPWFFVYSCNLSLPNDPEHVWFDESFVGWGMEDIELGYRLVRAGFQVVVDPGARVLHAESLDPRDPFRCEERGLPPHYDSYVANTVQLIDSYPDDPTLRRLLGSELRWYVRDAEDRHWVKNGFENDAEAVLARARALREAGASRPSRPEGSAASPTGLESGTSRSGQEIAG
jgi:glycosyltransferase involved in cell wall biosynthesis